MTDRMHANPAAPRGIVAGRRAHLRWLLLAVLLPAQGALAAEYTGRVVSVQSGDALTVQVSQQQIAVRLSDIDAPEDGQAYGKQSRQSLAQLCENKNARVRTTGKDRSGRALGRVVCATVDVNVEQVRRGMAWVYDRRVKDRSLYDFQDEARSAQRGLWAEPKPTAPWDWRRIHRRAEP
jgi:endonuclease YncB( thermonuclease family)